MRWWCGEGVWGGVGVRVGPGGPRAKAYANPAVLLGPKAAVAKGGSCLPLLCLCGAHAALGGWVGSWSLPFPSPLPPAVRFPTRLAGLHTPPVVPHAYLGGGALPAAFHAPFQLEGNGILGRADPPGSRVIPLHALP